EPAMPPQQHPVRLCADRLQLPTGEHGLPKATVVGFVVVPPGLLRVRLEEAHRLRGQLRHVGLLCVAAREATGGGMENRASTIWAPVQMIFQMTAGNEVATNRPAPILR